MKKEVWDFKEKDVAYYENDANGFYSSWVDFRKHSLVDLFDKWLYINLSGDRDVIIKAKKGILFFELVDREDMFGDDEE